MQNLYPESWLYLTGHCYVRSMFVKHHFVAVVVCLFVVAVFYYYYYYYCYYLFILLLLLLLLLLLFLISLNQTVNFLQSYLNFFPISNKVLIKNVMALFTTFLNNFRKPYITTYREELTRLKQGASVDVT